MLTATLPLSRHPPGSARDLSTCTPEYLDACSASGSAAETLEVWLRQIRLLRDRITLPSFEGRFRETAETWESLETAKHALWLTRGMDCGLSP